MIAVLAAAGLVAGKVNDPDGFVPPDPAVAEPPLAAELIVPAPLEPAALEPAALELAALEPAGLDAPELGPAPLDPAPLEPAALDPAAPEPPALDPAAAGADELLPLELPGLAVFCEQPASANVAAAASATTRYALRFIASSLDANCN